MMTVTNITFVTNIDMSITTNITPVTAALNYTSGTLQLINVGPTLQVGQRFVLFSEPVTAPIPIVTFGNFTVTDNLAVDGSVTVASVAQQPAATISKISAPTNQAPRITITATNNFGPGGSWDLAATNKISAPFTNWPIIMSGNFDPNGNATITLTNPVGGNAVLFFNLRTP
jgi:hypothetical protein